MKEIVFPDWFNELPDNASLNSKDMALLYGYKNTKALKDAVFHKRAPKPDGKVKGLSKHGLLSMWSVGYLRKINKSLE